MGTAITVDAKGKFIVPDDPIIPCIAGDGIGPDIWNAGKPVLDCAVAKAYGGRRRIEWLPVRAGEDCWKETGEFVPEATKEAITKYRVAIKGPLSTPVGKGFRSVNVMLRQMYDLYACVRPVSHIPGVPSPVIHPDDVNMVIFRENTEDLYAGVEWDHDTPEAERVIALIKELGKNVRPHSAIGIKPISEFGSKRLVRMAIQYAIDHKLPNVTLVHKGNIMKFTEGGFRRWGYEVAAEEFGDVTITEEEVTKNFGGKAPEGKIVIKDRITDAMFQQILGRCPYQSPTDMGVNMAGNCIIDDDACREASCQEIIRRYYQALEKVVKDDSCQNEAYKIELIMKQAKISPKDRVVVPAAVNLAKETDAPAAALELPDGKIVLGKTKELLGASAAVLLNAVKELGGIDHSIDLISPESIAPIQELKVRYLGSGNPRLHTDEVLIALSTCAATDENARIALEQLPKLRGCQVHTTVMLSNVDKNVFKKLGIGLTCEPVQEDKKIG